jgi:hypothetical protein
MRRTRHDVFAKATTTRYVVLWDMFRTVIECQRIAAGSDLRTSLATAVERFKADGWEPGCEADFGFVFLSREDGRRLLALTKRDPFNETTQSFDPYG